MSSSDASYTNEFEANSCATASRANRTFSPSLEVINPTATSIVTCAFDPKTSSAHRRLSKDRLSVYAINSSAGPDSKRPCHKAAPSETFFSDICSPLSTRNTTRCIHHARQCAQLVRKPFSTNFFISDAENCVISCNCSEKAIKPTAVKC